MFAITRTHLMVTSSSIYIPAWRMSGSLAAGLAMVLSTRLQLQNTWSMLFTERVHENTGSPWKQSRRRLTAVFYSTSLHSERQARFRQLLAHNHKSFCPIELGFRTPLLFHLGVIRIEAVRVLANVSENSRTFQCRRGRDINKAIWFKVVSLNTSQIPPAERVA